MRSIFAFTGTMADAQHGALALQEAGALDAFVTTFAWQSNGRANHLINKLPSPLSEKILRQLGRRSINGIDPGLVHRFPWHELVRTLVSRAGSAVIADKVWDRMSHQFDEVVSRRYVPHAQAVHSFEYIALKTFERAKACGVARVLHLPSLDSRAFQEIKAREKHAWPDLISKNDSYFDARFEQRQERRQREIELADLIITNSSLTARSHIKAGANADKVFAVPLAAPSCIADIKDLDQRRPLKVLWAGNFSLGKGAHYALEAWRQLDAGPFATLDVYGSVQVPERLLKSAGDTVKFHGSVPQSHLFKAYMNADVLFFPTLSDGFGLVVAEAMAHGLPVITTDQAGAADLVTPMNGMTVQAASSAALTDALRWCLDNRDLLAGMRHHALATAKGRQWQDYRQDLIATLDRGLRQAGYSPEYGHIARSPADSGGIPNA